jgi:hypothetical protein
MDIHAKTALSPSVKKEEEESERIIHPLRKEDIGVFSTHT